MLHSHVCFLKNALAYLRRVENPIGDASDLLDKDLIVDCRITAKDLPKQAVILFVKAEHGCKGATVPSGHTFAYLCELVFFVSFMYPSSFDCESCGEEENLVCNPDPVFVTRCNELLRSHQVVKLCSLVNREFQSNAVDQAKRHHVLVVVVVLALFVRDVLVHEFV